MLQTFPEGHQTGPATSFPSTHTDLYKQKSRTALGGFSRAGDPQPQARVSHLCSAVQGRIWSDHEGQWESMPLLFSLCSNGNRALPSITKVGSEP